MNCKKVKELILTDYLDRQVNEEQKKQIEKHLASCVNCKEYELAARKTVIEPFNKTERVNPPEEIWHKIKGQVEEEQKELANPFTDFIHRIKSLLYVPRPVLAVPTIVIVLLIVVTIIYLPSKKQETLEVNPESRIESINYMMSVFNQDSMDEDNGIATDIEEYFL